MNGQNVRIKFPIEDSRVFDSLKVGDRFIIDGKILCGRDAVLPKVCRLIEDNSIDYEAIPLRGSCIFHTAVSIAGVGPTSSNKVEIESSMRTLSKAGVRLHLGKGAIGRDTIEQLKKYGSIFAVIPPVTALLTNYMTARRVIAFPELGMEALYEIEVEGYPAIVAAKDGESVYE